MDSRQNACEMRSAGHTIGEIAKVLCIAYSTAQFWTKGVALTEEQRLSQYTFENVHHVDGIKTNNKAENLEL